MFRLWKRLDNRKKFMPQQICPDESRLRAFAVGDLPLEMGDSIADHVSHCSQCEAHVERFDAEAVRLVGQLFAFHSRESFGDEPEFQGIRPELNRLSRLGTGRSKDPTPVLQPGRLIGDYEILSPLGEGAMGTVYKARHRRLNRFIALKVLTERRIGDQRAHSRFCREMQAVGRLEHPNIVQAGDAGEVDGMLYLAMQFVDGLDLRRLSARVGRLRVCDACELVRQAAEGIECARQSGVVHRDIKPSNLILDRNGVVKVLDLGLALLDTSRDDQLHDLTDDGQIMGTLGYMAPEQIDDSHRVGTRADVYGLGATLYRLLTGRTPLADDLDSPLQKLRAIAIDNPTPIRVLRPDLPPALSSAIDSMLIREQSKRMPTPGSVAAALQPFVAESNLVALFERANFTDDVERLANSTSHLDDTQRVVSDELHQPRSATKAKRFRRVAYSLILIALAGAIMVATGWLRKNEAPTRDPIGVAHAEGEPISPDLEVAKWVLQKGGKLTITPASDASRPWDPHGVDDLPEEPFFVTDIEMEGAHLQPDDVKRLSALSQLNSLRVGRSNISDDDLVHFADLPLARLELYDTEITNRGIENLGPLPGLRVLVLNNTEIDDDAVKLVCQRYRITEAHLNGTAITDQSLEYLSQLPDIEVVSAERTNIGDEGAKHLLKLEKLHTFRYWQTRVSGEMDRQFELLFESRRQGS